MRDRFVIGEVRAAMLVAQQGLSVTLHDSERFPPCAIGESLLPYDRDFVKRRIAWDAFLAAAKL